MVHIFQNTKTKMQLIFYVPNYNRILSGMFDFCVKLGQQQLITLFHTGHESPQIDFLLIRGDS